MIRPSQGAEDGSLVAEVEVCRSTALGGGPKASHLPPNHHAGKRKANGLASPGGSMGPATRRPAPDAGSAPLPATSSAMGELAAVGSRQLATTRTRGDIRGRIGRAGHPASTQMGRSSPQPWIRTRQNPLSQPTRSTDACLPARKENCKRHALLHKCSAFSITAKQTSPH